MDSYNKVYDFTNENVGCLNDLYHFENSKVLTVVGSGDQYFTSILNGAKQVDLFDINPTSYLYFILKFYAIRELTFEEFYDFLIRKKLDNIKVYEKLEPHLPLNVLKYYQCIMLKNTKRKQKEVFRHDGIDLLCRKNQQYYFKSNYNIIPYLYKEKYYKLQELLKDVSLPKFYNCNFLHLKRNINNNYDIMLLSNISNSINIGIIRYTELLNSFDIPEIQASYDWYGFYLNAYKDYGYIINIVSPSSPVEFSEEHNFVYSLKK